MASDKKATDDEVKDKPATAKVGGGTFQLVSGIHQDETGTHTPDSDNIIKSDKDLVKLHGERFVRIS